MQSPSTVANQNCEASLMTNETKTSHRRAWKARRYYDTTWKGQLNICGPYPTYIEDCRHCISSHTNYAADSAQHIYRIEKETPRHSGCSTTSDHQHYQTDHGGEFRYNNDRSKASGKSGNCQKDRKKNSPKLMKIQITRVPTRT